jgi:hypothetical protein
MNEASAKIAQALKLPDGAYYAPSDEPFDRVAEAMAPDDTPPVAASAGIEPVFALGLPHAVALERGSDLPGAVMHRYSGARTWEAKLGPNLHLLVVDLRTGALKTVSPLMRDDPDFDPSRRGPPPSAVARRASLHGFTRFEVPALFGERWSSTSYAFTAVYYDWVSNTVTVAGKPPADLGPPLARTPSSFLAPAASSDARPAGLRLTLPAAREPGGALPLRGTVAEDAHALALAPLAGAPDRFVMVATLVFVALDSDILRTLETVVPVEVRGGTVVGEIALDLAARPEAARLGGEVQVFWVSGRTVSGPSALTIPPR